MNKKLLHSLAILALVFLAGQCELLTAQSGDIKKSGTDSPGFHHGLALANSHADSRQPPESHPDPGAERMAKTKVYKFRSIDYPGGNASFVYDFNGKTATGEFFSPETVFTFHGSSYAPLSVPGAIASLGYGINRSGEIVGLYEDSSLNIHGFLYDGSRYTTIDYPGSLDTEARDINDAGLIVGGYTDSNHVPRGFLYDNGNFTAINVPGADSTDASGINSSGDIVGTYANGSAHGFLLKQGMYSAIDVPFGEDTNVIGINDAGSMAGYFIYDGALHGFIYSGGIFTQVDVPGARDTFWYRIKNNGNVVGYVIDSLSEVHGIIGR